MRRPRSIGTYALVAFTLLAPGAVALAQTDVPGAASAVIISSSPVHPHPGDTVTLSITSSLYDVDNDTVTWQANGKTILQGVGEKTVTIPAGSLGNVTNVAVDISGSDGEASNRTTVTPSSVDILWESDSYVPAFYQGRRLPSAGTHVVLQAVPFLPKQGGGFYSADQLIYTWRSGTGTMASISGRGKSSAVIASPDLFGNYTISVQASSPDGSVTGESQVTIASLEPVLVLYQDHPLFGLESWNALGKTTFIAESEMSFAAVPYFAPATGPDDAALSYAWQVNGKSISADSAHPSGITLSAGDSGTLALVNLDLTHKTNFFMQADGSWGITFTQGGTNSGAPASDLFHGTQ